MPPNTFTEPETLVNSLLETLQFDHAMARDIERKLHPDPLRGPPELSDMIHFFSSNMDNPNVRSMLENTQRLMDSIKDEGKNFRENLDFSTLPVESRSVWVIRLVFNGLRDADGARVRRRGRSFAGSSREGLKQEFSLVCDVKFGSWADLPMPRLESIFIGLPSSKEVEEFLRQAMATPFPPVQPGLPNFLFFTNKLKQHESALRPFLDSLPRPFQWGFAPKSDEDRALESSYFGRQRECKTYMELARKKKEEGNKAFAAKNGKAAVGAYQEAIHFLSRARSKSDDDEKIVEVEQLMAICYANSSAANLMEGDSRDPQKALKDAKLAVKWDEDYAKGYVRLSRAHEALGDPAMAEEAIAKALRLPQLENHEGLVDHLIMLQTNGGGLPKDPEAFREWSRKVLVGDGAERMKNVGGLWRKRCEEHEKEIETLK